MESKRKSEMKHAQRRARERFGESFTKEDIGAMVKLIQRGQAEFVERQSIRITVFKIKYNETEYKVVYDGQRKMITTFLPSDETLTEIRKVMRGK